MCEPLPTYSYNILSQGSKKQSVTEKKARQKGIGSGRYRFSPSEQKSRRNTVTAAMKHRYGRKKILFMTIDMESKYFFN